MNHEYNGPYEGKNLDKVAFPIGGIGSGMFCLEGSGAISHMSVRNTMEFFNEPTIFPAIYVNDGTSATAKVLEGPIPVWKVFGHGGTSNGSAGKTYGLPRFEKASFKDRFPFGTVRLSDKDVPLDVTITGWNPFTPGNADDSSLPVGALEYKFTNTSSKRLQSVFSFNTVNFISLKKDSDRIVAVDNGFILTQAASENAPEHEGYFAVTTADSKTVVDHCWFRGGWWDPFTVAWNTIETGRVVNNPPQDVSAPGASLFVPFELAPGESKTVQVMLSWYVPNNPLKIGGPTKEATAFGTAPATGTGDGQAAVNGFVGTGLVNTFAPGGDGQTGTLVSPEFQILEKYIQFRIGGGSHEEKVCINLRVDGEVVRTATGKNSEDLTLETWDVSDYSGKTAQIEIVDQVQGGWGHLLIDHIVMTGDPDTGEGKILADFEGGSYGEWTTDPPEAASESCGTDGSCESAECEPTSYQPWYVSKFDTIKEVNRYWKRNYARLKAETQTFTDAFYDTTLPPEVVEAIAANLTILKSPTLLRLTNGRIWGWEGCSDGNGCCHGSCTHVWNYAQAIPHLFPALERSLRQTEFNESQNANGHQTFRSNIPNTESDHGFYAAADGQLGGIMKVYREWRISGDTEWLKEIWPKVRTSLDYCIKTWDPRHTGALEEPHHNTYDIEYWGPNGHCTSFYNGALNAAVKMGEALGDDVAEYTELLGKSLVYLEEKLYNGEYFYQQVMTEGLDAEFEPLDADFNGEGYQAIAEEINTQGPKYQYGTGCLSDGVLGFWIARACGLDELMDSEKIASHLEAVHKYNFKEDLYDHANPQRPSYALGHEAGLLICSWPNGGKPILPFVYSDEVWTGIEYQVASHLMMHGQVKAGLEIVRACRDRYDGYTRNPFNEYECGHWYARAMSSYGLLQGLTGLRYDAVDKSLFIESKVGDDFRAFLSTADGFGVAGLKNGKPFVEVRNGNINIKHVYVSGVKTRL
ncbi:MAG: hypothetical protein DRP64_10230 [Verrucomicrobia bacterium]|nr:MAG: hypothetical protein DRP64_10230 [Verrucomicrobiota bacterium]